MLKDRELAKCGVLGWMMDMRHVGSLPQSIMDAGPRCDGICTMCLAVHNVYTQHTVHSAQCMGHIPLGIARSLLV